jgi:hypothetical protein
MVDLIKTGDELIVGAAQIAPVGLDREKTLIPICSITPEQIDLYGPMNSIFPIIGGFIN